MPAEQSETIKWLIGWNRNMPSADETLVLNALAEGIDCHASKFRRFFPIPLAPLAGIQECIECCLTTLRLDILRNVPRNAEAVLYRDQQINAPTFRELKHGLHGHL